MTYSDLHGSRVATAPVDATVIAADSSHGQPPAAGRTDVLRIVLWVVLGLSVIGNTVASVTDAGTGPHLLFGAVSALSGVALVVRFLRARR